MASDPVHTATEQWFVARTRVPRQETRICDWLNNHGVETFVPWTRSDRKRTVGRRPSSERPAIPNLIFLKTDKETACSFITVNSLPVKYVIDCATHRMMVVPEKEMSDFQRVFDLSKDHGGLMDQPLELGDRVRIIKGALRGIEGYVVEILGRYYVAVSLLGVLWAKAQVPKAWLEKI